MTALVAKDWGTIDILINNAAVFVMGDHADRLPIHQYLDSDWRRILRVTWMESSIVRAPCLSDLWSSDAESLSI